MQQHETAGLHLFSCPYNSARFRICISQSHHVVALAMIVKVVIEPDDISRGYVSTMFIASHAKKGLVLEWKK